MMFLLDVNVLLAMNYTTHSHYARVDSWLDQLLTEQERHRIFFATCPITELGFVRVGSGKAGYASSVEIARKDLAKLKMVESMQFIPADFRVLDLPPWVRKSEQTTDGYLLALAKSHGGELVTLDRFIPGAVLIPDEPGGPLVVREEPLYAFEEAQERYASFAS